MRLEGGTPGLARRPAHPLCHMLTTRSGGLVTFRPGIVSTRRNYVTEKRGFEAGTGIADG